MGLMEFLQVAFHHRMKKVSAQGQRRDNFSFKFDLRASIIKIVQIPLVSTIKPTKSG
jgi:hypothetical protein